MTLVAGSAGAEKPLRLDDRSVAGEVPSTVLRFSHPEARSAFVRHEKTGWSTSHPMTADPEQPGHWFISVRDLEAKPGHLEYKFLPDDQWESGPNRYLYITPDGVIARPPALYLTWQRDPSTTMTIRWHHDGPSPPALVRYRLSTGDAAWREAAGHVQDIPGMRRNVCTVELTGLTPDTVYVFSPGGWTNTYHFRTLPDRLVRPVTFLAGGDVFHEGPPMDRMNALAGSLDPDFIVIGGDLAYADGRADSAWRWVRMFGSFYQHLRAPDGRIIPMVVAIGNHEMQNHSLRYRDDYEPTEAWRLRVAPYFYRFFAMPGLAGYNVLDFGDYARLLLLDTGHTTPVSGEQSEWLQARLAESAVRPHVFPVYHVPAWPSVRNPADPINEEIRTVWVPLFEQHGVKLAFEHHDHSLKITHPIRDGAVHPDGVIYLGDGAWSVNVREPAAPGDRWFLRLSGAINHVFEVTLEPDRRTVRTIDINGHERDRFEQPVFATEPQELHYDRP